MYKNVLWIDPSVRDYQVFIDSVNSDTLALVFPEPLRFDVERIGFVFEKGGPMASYLLENADLLVASGVKTMDFLACETLPEWQPFYDKLIGIQVGASNNKTGNLLYGGDWILESTCEDIEPIYFTKSIQYYQYLLGSNAFATFVIDIEGNFWSGARTLNGYYTLGFSGVLSAQLKQGEANVTKMSVSFDNAFLIINRTVYSCGGFNIGRTGTANVFASIGLTGATEVSAGEGSGYAIADGFIYTFTDTGYSKLLIGGNNVRADRIRHFSNTGFVYLYNGVVYNHLGIQISPAGVTIVEIAIGRFQVMGISSTRELYSGTIISIKKVSGIGNVNAISCGSTKSDYNLIIVDKQLYERVGSSDSFTKVTGMDNVTQIYSAEDVRYAIHNNILYGAGSTLTDITTTGAIGSYSPMLKIDQTVMNTAAILPDGHFVPLNEYSINVTSIDVTVSNVNSYVNIYGYSFNTSTVSSLSIGTTSIAYSILNPNKIQFRTPNLFLTNTSVTLYTPFTQFRVTSTFTIPPLFSISGYNTSTFTNDTLKIYGSNFLNISYVQFRNIQRIVTNVSSTQINVSVPGRISGNVSILVGDIYGNTSFISDTIYVMNIPKISYTIQYQDRVTLIGDELNNLDIGIPLLFPSETAPVYKGYINGLVNFYNEDTITNVSVETYPIKVTQANLNAPNPEVVTVRGMTPGKLPNKYGIKTNTPDVAEGVLDEPYIEPPSGWTIVSSTAPLITSNTRGYTASTNKLTITQTKGYASRGYTNIIMTLYNYKGESIVIKTDNLGKTSTKTYTLNDWSGILYGNNRYLIRYQVTTLGESRAGAANTLSKLYQNLTIDINRPNTLIFYPPFHGHATCYFGYFKPTISTPYTFTLKASFTANLKLGTSLYDLRNNKNTLINISSLENTVVTTSIHLVDTMYYAIMLTSIHSYADLLCEVNNGTTESILQYCTLDKVTSGLYYYRIENELYYSIMKDEYDARDRVFLTSKISLDRMSRIYSPTWAYGNASNQTFWINGNLIPLIEDSLPFETTRLSITRSDVIGSNTRIIGTGLHANVSVYDNGILKPSTFNGTLTVAGTLTSIVLKDEWATSNTYIGAGVTDIEKSIAPRNASVHLYGFGLSPTKISSIKIGDIVTTYAFLSTTTIQMKVPDSIQTNALLRVVSSDNTSYIVTQFTIPPPFSLTSYNSSVLLTNTPLQMFGLNFMNMSYVQFGNTNVRNTSFNPTTIWVTPPSVPGNVSVTLFDEYGNSSTGPNLNVVKMTIDSVTKDSSGIQILGNHFYDLSYVNFGGTILSSLTYTTTSIRFADPNITGNISIGVYGSYGNNASISFVTSLFSITGLNASSIRPQSTLHILGTNLQNISKVRIGGQNVSAFNITPTSLDVTVPTNLSESVTVTIIDQSNVAASTSLTILNPTITSIHPSPVTRGDTLSIRGNHLENTSYVVFQNISVPYTSRSNQSVAVIVPSVNSGSLTVYDEIGNQVSFPYEIYLPFELTSINPSRAVQRSPLDLIGTNFSNVSAVRFGTVPATVLFNTSTRISVIVPDQAPQRCSIFLYDKYNIQTSFPFDYLPTLTLTTVNSSAIQRSTLILEGTGFVNLSAVLFGNVSANFSYTSTTLTTVVPEQNVSSCVIHVYDLYNNNTSGLFRYLPTLKVTSVNPSAIQRSTLTLSGSGFKNLSAVMFGNVSSNFSYTSTTLTTVVPDQNISSCVLTVYDEYNNTSVLFTYRKTRILEFPPSGPAGRTIQLKGDYFVNLSYVLFGNTSILLDNTNVIENTINLSVPVGTGTTIITIYDIYRNTTSVGYSYENISLTRINPSKGAPRQKVNLEGLYLNVSYVTFGGIPATVLTSGNGSVNVSAPVGSGIQPVVVFDVYGNSTSSLYEFQSPSLYTLSSAPPNASIVLAGEYLENTSYVSFGQQTIIPSFVNGSWIVRVPPGTDTTVVVTDVYGNNTSQLFTYRNPRIQTVNPSGATQKWVVTVAGENLENTTQVWFKGQSLSFSTSPIRFILPPGLGNASIRLIDRYGNPTQLDTFQYKNPSITSLNLSSGRTNQKLKVVGQNLENTSHVLIGGTRHVGILETNASGISVFLPEKYENVSVIAVDICGNQTAFGGNLFCTGGEVSLSGVSPLFGPHNTQVVITGTNLSYTTEVLFGGINASILSVTGTQINVSAKNRIS